MRLFIPLILGWFNLQASPTPNVPTPHTFAVVRVVLFFSPSCGHCAYVIQEALPPILSKYGNQLHIVGVDVSQPVGMTLFQAAIKAFNMESSPVPTLIIGDSVLIGSVDIPERLPSLVDQYLAQGGVDWPAIPGLIEALSRSQTALTQTALPSSTQTSLSAVSDTPAPSTRVPSALTPTDVNLILTGEVDNSVWGRISRDPIGNTLAIIVLVGMVASVITVIFFFHRTPGATLTRPWNWAIPALCILGVGIASYLAYVEAAQLTAVCGPVGDCNAVQQSEYARLFGVLHIGMLGILGYILILLAWCIGQFAKRPLDDYANIAVVGMAAFGTLFSIYLTFLEPFVIGATCAWCLTSAILMTALLWLSVPEGKPALSSLLRESKDHPVVDEQKS